MHTVICDDLVTCSDFCWLPTGSGVAVIGQLYTNNFYAVFAKRSKCPYNWVVMIH